MGRYGRFILAALALAFVLAACAPTAAQPTATPAPAVPTAAPDAAQPLVLVLPAYSEQKTLIAANRHYSDAVKRKGWNVEFYTVQSSGTDGTESYLPYVNKQLCSGTARADGFVCMQVLSPGEDQTLQAAKANGLLYDCAAVAPSMVPQYWAKFHDQISAGKYGLTLGTQTRSVRIDEPVLLVRDDILPLAAQGMSSYDDLHSLLARLQQDHTSNEYVQADPQSLLDLWIKQQGYLALFADAGIYTRMDDPDARAVLLEDIPGFEQFLQERVDLQAKGLLQSGATLVSSDGSVFTSGQNDKEGSTGPAATLVYAYNLIYFTSEQGRWKGYTAFLPTDDRPYADDWYDAAANTDSAPQAEFLREMIIPARSRRSTDAMAFIQWIYADRRNADVVIYGQEGEDYKLQEERVELMGSNAPQDSQALSPWQNWPGYYLFQLAAERRIDAGAPKNTEALLHSQPPKPLAAPWLALMSSTVAWGKLMNQGFSDQRQNATSYVSELQIAPGTTMDAKQLIKELHTGATEEILQPYLDVLTEARAAMAQH